MAAMKKRLLSALFCLCFLLAALPGPAYGDIGPKPSVVVSFEGLAGETYYATLLSQTSSTGPYSAAKSGGSARYYDEDQEAQKAHLKFLDYQDRDGFYYLQFLTDCSKTQELKWTYYPPQEFKILLYFLEYDSFAVSAEGYSRYAFDSYYKVDVSEKSVSEITKEAVISAQKNYDYTAETLNLLARILLTVLAETALALPFGYSGKKQLKFIAAVNIGTQGLLNLALNVINYSRGPWAFKLYYVLLELLVLAIEGALYRERLEGYGDKPSSAAGKGPVTRYALLANLASFFLGLILAEKLPGLF